MVDSTASLRQEFYTTTAPATPAHDRNDFLAQVGSGQQKSPVVSFSGDFLGASEV